MLGKDGVMVEWKSQAGLLYADDVCLMARSEEELNVIMEQVNECVIEHRLKMHARKSKVVCIHGEDVYGRWDTVIQEKL